MERDAMRRRRALARASLVHSPVVCLARARVISLDDDTRDDECARVVRTNPRVVACRREMARAMDG